MSTITLHGDIAMHLPTEMCGVMKCVFNTIAEGAAAIEANFPGFFNLIRERNLHVVMGDDSEDESKTVGEEVLNWDLGGKNIHILPAIEGSKNQAKMIIGAILIVAAIAIVAVATAGAGLALAAPVLGGLTTVGGLALTVGVMGIGMLVSGLAPTPEVPSLEADDITSKGKASSVYGGPLNTQDLGGPVPVCLGNNILAGGVLIHGCLTIEQMLDSPEGSG